ncbi:MAG: hypothetical protein H0V65_00430 [Chitinophagales bacterium]|nr:hypothetical protein [Chitinophagales bacterium]
MRETSVKKIAAVLRNLKSGHDKKSSILFLGAGASASAGMPIAQELAEILERDSRFTSLLEDCPDRQYSTFMRELNPSDRKQFLNEYISKAKLQKYVTWNTRTDA